MCQSCNSTDMLRGQCLVLRTENLGGRDLEQIPTSQINLPPAA